MTSATATIPVHATGCNPEDGPSPAAEEHPGGPGHLPPSRKNMRLVGKAELTQVEGGIADVAAFGDYAYLNAFSPECVSNGGAGTGVHIVDIDKPRRPTKVGFIPAHPNSFVGEGIHVVRAGDPRTAAGDTTTDGQDSRPSTRLTSQPAAEPRTDRSSRTPPPTRPLSH